MATVNFGTLQKLLVAHDATWAVGVALVLLFAALSFFGIQAFARVEIFLTACMWLTLLIFGSAACCSRRKCRWRASSAHRRWAPIRSR